MFTPAMAFIMGKRGAAPYVRFETLACRAYNILRQHADHFLTLLSMMLSTGIPELQEISDIAFMRDAFQLSLSNQDADLHMLKLITVCLGSFTTRLNFAVHSAVHAR